MSVSTLTACTDCELSLNRTMVVIGSGNPSPIMLIGDAPGYSEDITGEPFVGRAGALLLSLLEPHNLTRDNLYITNTVKCRPPENRKPLPREIETCTKHLIDEIVWCQPRAVVLLGHIAASLIFPSPKLPINAITITNKYSNASNSTHYTLFTATHHPAAILRNSNTDYIASFHRAITAAKAYVNYCNN